MANSKNAPIPILLMCGFLFVTSAKADGNAPHPQTWYEAPDVGWSWYKDAPLKQKKNNKEKSKNQQSKAAHSSEDDSERQYAYTKQMEKMKKDFEELQAKAILNPTLENVARFQKEYGVVVNRSTDFEKAWMTSSLLSAANYRESDQPSPMHRKIYQEKTEKQLEEDIFALAKTYGVFFIFKQDCPYCHEMAPTVKQLVDRYGFNIKAISPDGHAIEGFPDVVKDNGAISQINPEGVFPVVFLVNPHSGQTIPLARGLTNLSELKENFKVIIQYLKEQTHAR